MQYLLGFVWGFVLLASFAGWGLALQRILSIASDQGSPDWGQAIVLGMSGIIAVGGFLNVLWIMTWGVALSLVLAGLVLFAVEISLLRSRSGWSGVFDWPMTKTDIIAWVGCLLTYSANVCMSLSPYGDTSVRQQFALSPWDDLMGGYITLPVRLLIEGNLGEDRFNDFRTFGLGGYSLLQAFPLLILPPTYIHVMDPGLAILALPLVLHGLGRRHGWPAWLAPVLTLFCLVLRSPRLSASPSLLPTLFLLSLYGMLEDLAMQRRARTSDLCALALVSMALMTMKNTFVPGAGLILGIYLILDWIVRRNLYRSLVSGLTVCLVILVLLAPWLVSMYGAAGTLLYPLLGEGYRANPMVEMPHMAPIRDLASEARAHFEMVKDPRILLFFLLGALGLAVSVRPHLWNGRGIAYIAFLLGSIPILLLFFRTFQMDWIRFSYSYLTLVMLTSFALLLGGAEERAWLQGLFPGGSRWIAGFLILLTLAGVAYECKYVPQTAAMITNAVTGQGWDPDAELPSYRRMQASIPAGRRFLALLPMTHLLDFGRNPINVVDTVCGISPPPGIPLGREPEDVAQYLRVLGISWIAARETTWYPGGETRDPEDFRRLSERYTYSAFRSQGYSYYLMLKCVKSLAATYETTRFENNLVLINLNRPRVVPRGESATLSFHSMDWH